MGAKAVRHKGDGLTVRQQCRRFLLERLKAGDRVISHRHGNGSVEVQWIDPTRPRP